MADDQTRNPQLDVIETLDRPVIVQAGAGSGKTHTLTERIVASLTGTDDEAPFARSVENIVAITFTHKAAEELKARLRTKLEKAGLHEEALLVDDAFITTIHGFASRILRENALKFGIDADFEIIDEAKDEEFFNGVLPLAIKSLMSGKQLTRDLRKAFEAGVVDLRQLGPLGKLNMANRMDDFEDLIDDLDDDDDDDFPALDDFDDANDFTDFDPLPFANDGFDANDFKDITDTLLSGDGDVLENEEFLEQINSMFADLVMAHSMLTFGTIFMNKIFAEDSTSTKKSIETIKRIVTCLSCVSDEFNYHIFEGTHLTFPEIIKRASKCITEALSLINFDLTDDDEITIVDELRSVQSKLNLLLKENLEEKSDDEMETEIGELLEKVPKLTPKFHSKGADYDAVVAYRENLARLAIEFFASANRAIIEGSYSLGHQTLMEMDEAKCGTYLSNNDLLRFCCQKLFEYPEVADYYRERFDLIMVDEFQDTDNLQMDLIAQIAKEKFKNVCTVGDIQQSIYRFRGADVNVFKDYKDTMLNNDSNVKIVNLPNNYRSHADVLALTDKIFASDDMFGDDFLHLYPKGKINDEEDPIFKDIPRIQIEVMNHQVQGKAKFLTREAVQRQARKAALHLKSLKDAGASPGSMAVLLSRLTSGADTATPTEFAKIYSDELAKVGIESIISGGSTFARSNEAQTALALLAIARNALDTQSLMFLLRSEFFNLSDDALLVMATVISNANDLSSIKKRDISKGFLSMDESQLSSLSEEDRATCLFAQARIVSFIENARSEDMVDAIRAFLSQCGVFDHLNELSSEGLVKAGNYEKALSIIKEFEEKTTEIVELHQQFSTFLENAKEAPGILSTVNSDYVQIMTVHASKGLEFDHVVAAELRDGKPRNKKTIVKETSLENVGERFLCMAGVKDMDLPDLKKLAFDKDLTFSREVVPHRNMTAGELYIKMVMNEATEELDEAKRLLYVAVTRAVKSVLLQVRINKKAKDDYEGTGIWKPFYDVFQWDYSCAKSTQFFQLENGSVGKLTFEALPQVLEFEEEEQEDIQDEGEVSPSTSQCFVFRQPVKRLKRVYGEKKESDFLSYSNFEKVYAKSAKRLNVPETFSLSGEEELQGRENLFTQDEDKATDFGLELHTFFEKGVINKKFDAALIKSKRLEEAVMRVFSTKPFVSIMESDNTIPEMEFCVPLQIDDNTKFMRGEMDLVALEENSAHVIDYKTGTKPIDHLLQAQVYAYALLKAGKKEVVLDFIHAEIPDPDGEGALVQTFKFKDSDLQAIEERIVEIAKEVI